MKPTEWHALAFLGAVAAAWLSVRGTAPVPLWAVVAWSLALASTCLWIGVNAGAWAARRCCWPARRCVPTS
jgi:hypothetical protein